MAIQDSKRLRQLVSDYYHGLITQDSYREQRKTLLDNIGAETAEQPDTVAREQPPAPEKPEPEEFAETQPLSVSLDKSSGSGFRPKSLVVGVAVLGGVAVVAYLVFVQDFGVGTGIDSSGPQSNVIEERSSKFGDSLIEDFLGRSDWSADSLNNFFLAWNSLDDVEREHTTEGRPYRRLRIRLHQRIGEEAALGDVASNSQLEALTDFATKIGAPYRESRAAPADVLDTSGVLPEVDDEEEPEIAAIDRDMIEDVVAETESVQPDVPAADETEVTADDVAAQPEVDAIADDPCPAEIAATRRPYCQDILSDGSMGPPLVVLPTGSFEMGSDDFESESPPHQVEIANHIAISLYEITAAEYGQFCAATNLICSDSDWSEDHPVVSVSWDDASLYTQWLSEDTRFTYRLPSEAEWEFAARAGTGSPYYFGDEITPSAAHSSVNGEVDSPLPRTDRTVNRNPFRLYHMSGNVREWMQDAWYPNYENAPLDGSARLSEAGTLKVVRGGSYADPGAKLRSAARESLDRSHNDAMTGFRVVREVSSKATDN
jgi:formylglycine-generating enzyme required for sulfatase activity